MRIVKYSLVLSALALVGLSTTVAHAEEADEKAVAYRQAVLRVMGTNFGPLVMMVRGMRPYDAEQVELRATRINQMSQMIEEAFTRDTTGVKGLKTDALDKIWGNWDDFTGKISTLQEVSLALANAPADEASFQAAFKKVGGACKGCHDNYKKD